MNGVLTHPKLGISSRKRVNPRTLLLSGIDLLNQLNCLEWQVNMYKQIELRDRCNWRRYGLHPPESARHGAVKNKEDYVNLVGTINQRKLQTHMSYTHCVSSLSPEKIKLGGVW